MYLQFVLFSPMILWKCAEYFCQVKALANIFRWDKVHCNFDARLEKEKGYNKMCNIDVQNNICNILTCVEGLLFKVPFYLCWSTHCNTSNEMSSR